MTRYLSTTETAKLVRAHLKSKYDGGKGGWKYSVRSDKYAGGSAVRVEVPANYPQDAERALYRELTTWGSSGFDGMTDSSYSKSHTLCPIHGVSLRAVGGYWGASPVQYDACCSEAEDVSLGASYVTVSRSY